MKPTQAVHGSRPFQGAIFDVDGVLVDSPHYRAWRDALQELMDTEWAELRGQTSYCPEKFTEALYQQVIAGRPRLAGALAALEYFGVPDADRRAPLYAAVKQEHLVVEDAAVGVQAAKAGGMAALGVARLGDEQNHLLQVLALVAMDPPAGASAGDTQDKKAEVFRAMPPADPQHCVRGQYQGYADVPGVASGSATETFVALRLEIDNWRWADVPIFLRAGKALPHKVTEVRLLLRRTPRLAFLPEPTRAEPNQIVLRIDPDPGLRLQLSALAGQSWRTVHLDTSFARELGEPPEPYEVLLHAAMVGDHQYFAREDSVEETWRIVQPLLDHPADVRPYPRGSWGPEEAETLLRGHPRWQQPWLPEEG